MGKVKDEVSASKPSKPSKGKPGGAPERSVRPVPRQPDSCRPVQADAGLVRPGLHCARAGADRGRRGLAGLRGDRSSTRRSGGSGCRPLFAVVLGWIIFRIVHFPPFAEFLIATEAEMNKVSWTSKEDLIRATTVVLTTVVLMAVFLFVVDSLWTFILRMIGVLQFGGGGGFGSTA